MAKLKQIIGGILRDVSRARAISDAYSQELRSTYREDPFLKLLSVPRTGIKDVTIDLKFAIKPLNYGTTLYEDYALHGVQKNNVNLIEFGIKTKEVLGRLRRLAELGDEGEPLWVEEKISDGILKVISQYSVYTNPNERTITLNKQTEFVENAGPYHTIIIDLHTRNLILEGETGQTVYEILRASAPGLDQGEITKNLEEMEVEVVTQELSSLPEATLSSITLKLDLTSV